ncbi:hypothetical protein V6N13_021446 [Hibiscus sabdariffa]|uniref:Uncharacterized protein n=2 Tax=Hibiscus sabdariffa TaxID=183260 RepID=A0ABR2AIQ9_9ROSI
MSEGRQSNDDDPATPIPQTLAAEQPTEGSDRIPSRVFARTTTASPRQWSFRSNESLFSLHTGNMSFTKEQLNLMSKSGEFCFGCDSTLSSPLPPVSPSNNLSAAEIAGQGGNISLHSESLFSIRMGNTSFTSEQMNSMSKSGEFNIGFDPTNSSRLPDTPCNNQTETGITEQSGGSNEGCHGDTEAEAADTTAEKDSQVPEDNVDKEPTLPHNVPQNSEGKESQHHEGDVHQESPDASAEHFAFPILTGDVGKNRLSAESRENQNLQECPTPTIPETPETTEKTQTPPETPKLGSPKETSERPPESPKPQTPKATRNEGPSKWLACFSCCTANATS